MMCLFLSELKSAGLSGRHGEARSSHPVTFASILQLQDIPGTSHTVTAFRSDIEHLAVTWYYLVLFIVYKKNYCLHFVADRFIWLFFYNPKWGTRWMACTLAYVYAQLLLTASCGLVLGTFGEFGLGISELYPVTGCLCWAFFCVMNIVFQSLKQTLLFLKACYLLHPLTVSGQLIYL